MKHIDNKLIREYSKTMSVLYVEDDAALRSKTSSLFENYFLKVDTAEDGQEGLQKYRTSNSSYDLIISDIDMPHLSGIEMCREILAFNPEQAVVFITAHNEIHYLQQAINLGVNGFLTKPLQADQLKATLFKVCQAVCDHRLINRYIDEMTALTMQLNIEKKRLEEQIRRYEQQSVVVEIKHQQLENLLEQGHGLLNEYFAEDEDEGDENVLFLPEDCEELSELFDEILELLSRYDPFEDTTTIFKVSEHLQKISSILLHYTPFLDPLAKSFEDLSISIAQNSEAFVSMFQGDQDQLIALFDAIANDVERYTRRFSVESMAMKNIHHIHEPTKLSIRQIIAMFMLDESNEDAIEFF